MIAVRGALPRRQAGGDKMAKTHKGVRHHLAAAEHLERAAGHHREAARLYGADDPARAHREAEAADARTGIALQFGSEAEKFHAAQFRLPTPDRPVRSRLLRAVAADVPPAAARSRGVRVRRAPPDPGTEAVPVACTAHGIVAKSLPDPRAEGSGAGAPTGDGAGPTAHESVNAPRPHAGVTPPAGRPR